MKKFFNYLIIINLFFISQNLISKTFFYEVTKNNSKSYFLGTIHVGDESIYPLDKSIINAFKNSQALILENYAGEPNKNEEFRNLLFKHAFLKEGDNIKKHISKKQYLKLHEEFEKLGLPDSEFKTLRPWYVGSRLINVKITQFGYKFEYDIENYFINESKMTNKPIKSLDSIESYIKFLSEMDKDNRLSFLDASIDRIDKYDSIFKTMLKTWKTGDEKGYMKMYLGDFYCERKFKKLVKHVVYERNNQLTKKCENYLKEKKTYFFIINSGNLLGNKGILNQLKSKGYKIKQM